MHAFTRKERYDQNGHKLSKWSVTLMELFRSHSHRANAIGLMVVALTCTVLSACSSPAPTASLVASTDHLGPGQAVTLSGALSQHKAGLAVRLESSVGGSFAATGDSAATDGAGSYTMKFLPKLPGAIAMRVEIIDGKRTVASPPVQIRVLAATGVSSALDGPAEVGIGARATVSGSVVPGAAGRHVALQTSPDGSAWSATTVTGTTASTGRFTLTLPTQAAGPTIWRVLAAASDAQAEGTSPAVHLYIADYKAAGAKYLACVAGGNAALDTLRSTFNAYTDGATSLSSLQANYSKYAGAMRTETACLHAYVWPQSVSALVADLQAQSAVDIDNSVRLSKAKGVAEFNLIANEPEDTAALATASADAAKIRRALGLPARS
jgi:hypothetical protein